MRVELNYRYFILRYFIYYLYFISRHVRHLPLRTYANEKYFYTFSLYVFFGGGS
jgi:hypothetical protein